MDVSLNKLQEVVKGQGSLLCHSPWGHKESDTTEWLNWPGIEPDQGHLGESAKSPNHWTTREFPITGHWIQFPVLYSKTLLFIESPMLAKRPGHGKWNDPSVQCPVRAFHKLKSSWFQRSISENLLKRTTFRPAALMLSCHRFPYAFLPLLPASLLSEVFVFLCSWCVLSLSRVWLCNPMDCGLPASSVHGNSPGENTGLGCLPSFRISSWLRDWTHVSCITGRFFTAEPLGKPTMLNNSV